MRKFYVVLIVLCFGYFLIGGIVFWLGGMSEGTYLFGAGIVGGLASVLGLFSLVRPALSRTDIQNIEIESIKAISEQSKKIEQLETVKNATQKEIVDLEIRKREMEFLVRKASLSLFLKEQHGFHERRVREEIQGNPALQASIIELMSLNSKIKALDEEIGSDPQVQQLREIIEAASKRNPTIDEVIGHVHPFFREFYLGIRYIVEMLTKKPG